MQAWDWFTAMAATALGWVAVLAFGWWRARPLARTRRARGVLLWLYLAGSGLAGTWGVVSAYGVAFTYHTHTPNLASLLVGYVLDAVCWPFLALQGLLFLLGTMFPNA